MISPSAISPLNRRFVEGQEPFSFGNALQFDGVNDYVSFNNTSNIHLSANNFTISFWFKLTSSVASFCHFINLKSDVGQALCFTTANTSRGLYSGIGVNFSSQNLGFGTQFTPTIGDWHHLGITGKISNSSNSDFICLYDGNVLAQRGGGGYGVLANQTTLARDTIYKSPMILDEIVFYNNYLATQTELESFYNNGNGEYPSIAIPSQTPTAYWRCNEADDATTLADEQGTYNGILNNFSRPPEYWVAH